MQIGQGLCQVLPEAVFIAVERVRGEQGDMVDVHGRSRVLIGQQHAEGRLLHGYGRSKQDFVFRPFSPLHRHILPGENLAVLHRGQVAQEYRDIRRGRLPGRARPEGKPVLRAFFQADAEPSAVLQSRLCDGMAGILQPHVMGIPVEGAAFVQDLHFPVRFPTLQGVVILEGAVADFLRIQAAVRGEIDVLQENAVHRRLDGNSRRRVIHNEIRPPRLRRKGRNGQKCGQTEGQSLSHFTSHSKRPAESSAGRSTSSFMAEVVTGANCTSQARFFATG